MTASTKQPRKRGRKDPAGKTQALELEMRERPGVKITDPGHRDRLTTAIDSISRRPSISPDQAEALKWARLRVSMWTALPARLEAELLTAHQRRETRPRLSARCMREMDRFLQAEHRRQDALLIDSAVKMAAQDGAPVSGTGKDNAFERVGKLMLRSAAAIKKRYYDGP